MTDAVVRPMRTVCSSSLFRPLAAWCLSLASIAVTVDAQSGGGPPDDYIFSAVTEGVGLSPVVRAVHQTRDGYLWIATEAGLSRFDGVEHHVFRATNTPALKHSIIRTLYEDAAGALWVGTEHGLARYHAGTFEAIALPDTAVAGVAEDAAGSVWIGTASQGLFEYREGRLIAHDDEPLLREREIQFVFADSLGRVWIGLSRRRGVVRYEKGVFSRVSGARDRRRHGGGHGRESRPCAVVRDGNAWRGASERRALPAFRHPPGPGQQPDAEHPHRSSRAGVGDGRRIVPLGRRRRVSAGEAADGRGAARSD